MKELKEIAYRVGPGGMLEGFSYHDGGLLGVHLLRRPDALDVRLDLVTYDERRVELLLCGVTHLDVTSFRQGNIVLDIRLVTVAEAVVDAELVAAMANRLYLDSTRLPATIGSHVLFLSSSYGAGLIATLHGIRVMEAD